jgi:polyhydroxybutyrate depolymerase
MGVACAGDDDATGDAPKPSTSRVVPADRSAGCGTSSVKAGEKKVTLRSSGLRRWYYRHVPPAHDGRKALPVVIDLHGYSEGADIHVKLTKLGPYGDQKGFVTLTPQGDGVVPRWQTAVGSIDVVFVGKMLDDVEKDLCIDRARVFVAGLSNGATMTSTLACTLSDRIAAVATVSGASWIKDCAPLRPVPVVAFHGTGDPFLDYDGGFGPAVSVLPAPDGSGRKLGDLRPGRVQSPGVDQSRSVPEIMAAWARRNGCKATPPQEQKVAGDVTELIYDCPPGDDTQLYRVEGGGHSWPGSELLEGMTILGRTTHSIDTDTLVWDFFEKHPLRG